MVDNTTLEVVNLTVAAEEDHTTLHRVVEAAVAAGKSILDEISSRPTFLRPDYPTIRRRDSLPDHFDGQ